MWILYIPFLPAIEIRPEHITVRLGDIPRYKEQQRAWACDDDRKTNMAPSFRLISLWQHKQFLGGRSINCAPGTTESMLLFVEHFAKWESNCYSGSLLLRRVMTVQEEHGGWFYLKGVMTRHADQVWHSDCSSLILPWDPGVQVQIVSPTCKLFRPVLQAPLVDSYRLWGPGDFQRKSAWELPIRCFDSQRPITCKAPLQHGHIAKDILLKIEVARPLADTTYDMVFLCSAETNTVVKNSAPAGVMWCLRWFLHGGVHPMSVQLTKYGDQVDRVHSWFLIRPWDPGGKQLRQAPLDKLLELSVEVQWL